MEQLQEFIGNHLLLVGAFVVVLSLLISNIFAGITAGGKQVACARVVKLINQENAVVFDLREEKEYASGHILDAIPVPYAKLSEKLEGLGKYKERPVILCCASGSVSARASTELSKAGFQQLYRLKGGMMSWHSDNLPTIR